MADWLVPLLGGSAGMGVVWGIVEIFKTIANRPIRQVTAADMLSDSALEQVKQALAAAEEARKEAREARREADEARREANEARREAVEARRDAMNAAANMRRIVTAIQSPYATLEQLRAMVSDPPSSNGNGTAVVRG